MHSKMGPIFKTCHATLSQLAEFALQNMWCTALKIMTCTHPAWLIVFLQVSRTMTRFLHGLDGTKAGFTTYFGMNRYDSEWSSQINSITRRASSSTVRLGRTQRGGVMSIPIFDWREAIRWATGHVFFDEPHTCMGWFVVDLWLICIIFSIQSIQIFWWVKNFDPLPMFLYQENGPWRSSGDQPRSKQPPTKGRSQQTAGIEVPNRTSFRSAGCCFKLCLCRPKHSVNWWLQKKMQMIPNDLQSFRICSVVPLSPATWPAKSLPLCRSKEKMIATSSEK